MKFEKRFYLNNDNLADLSDSAIFTRIASLEAEIASLDQIKNKPDKLVKVIADHEKTIAKLVKYVDQR